MENRPNLSAGTGIIDLMDIHAEADATFGPCLIPGCPGSVYANALGDPSRALRVVADFEGVEDGAE